MTLSSINQRCTYNSRIEDCDVIDQVSLNKYRAKREEWLEWYELHNDEPNSIQQQILSMIFIDLLPNDGQATSGSGPEYSAKSGLLAHLLDQGYVATQVLAIRRLLDKRKDVVSLRRLFDDIVAHKHLFTREIYVGHDGLPYEFDAWKALPPSIEKQIWGIEAPGLSQFLMSRQLHEKFDRLSGVQAANRQRSDLVRQEVFDRLKQWLESPSAERLITLSHKFLAHAADVNSRGSLSYSGIQLSDVTEVHRDVIRIERAITDELLFIGIVRNVVPMTPLGFLKGLDHPYVQTEFKAKMEEHWKQLADERDEWLKSITNDLYN